MEQKPPSRPETSPFGESDRRRIDVAKEMFRLRWEKGEKPLIEQYWHSFPELLRPAALSALLQIEFRMRRASGEKLVASEYIRRFPEFAGMVANLLEASVTDIAPDQTATRVDSGQLAETGLADPVEKSPVSDTDISIKVTKTVPNQFGRYELLSELGRGGMGAVYLAKDCQLHRKVALKIPLFEDPNDLEAVERFYREARTMATVQHANLCQIYDVGQFEQWHFLTMAYVDGQPLSRILKKEGTLPVVMALQLMKTVSIAVQKAHEAGIIHRDLKPSNIMLTKENEPVIMDFGLARRKNAGEVELTQTGAVFGSPAYMAPEQVEARHHEVGPATDVYALGVILFQMVTGRRPFEGSVMSVFGQIVSQDPAPPSRIRGDLPHAIDLICLKALSKSPLDRYPTAAKFAEELSALASTLQRLPQAEARTMTFAAGLELPSESFKEGDTGTSSRTRREAELRQVTVAVFNYEADESSLSISRSSHSELLHQQSNSFSSFVSERVERMGGVTVQGSGTEVIACFGFPQTFEDAPQRAVTVALQLMRDLAAKGPKQSELPPVSQAWVVLHSGEAVAEELDSVHGSGISLVGDARNTAMRLNAVVEPGSIVISPATHQRVAVYFECESLGTQRVRGISQPVELFKVINEAASRNRVELADPGNLTPLIGRDTELSILKDRWEQAHDGLGQIVLLIGDAGLGKSRLIREIREHVIEQDSEQASVIEWRCSQHQQGTGYFPIVEFLSRLLDFENHAAEERLELVLRYMRQWKFDSAENVSLMCGLLGVKADDRFPPLALSPQKIKERTERLLLQWLQQLVEVCPLLFIVEDLHWLDTSTLELLEKHVLEFQTGRMLSILTFRPEFETPWKSKPHQTQIALNRLTKRQIGEMMRKRTRRREIPEAVLQQVIERTDGIPLFVEEFTVVIVESGILDRSDKGIDDSSLLNVIPATLHDLLLSRLDRMAADREVIQLAATIGREFGLGLLAAACTLPQTQLKAELDKLLKAEILFQKGEAKDTVYIFKHALLQDAAYRSMLTKKRQFCHQRIAEVLENHFWDIVQSQPALLAYHFTEAGVATKAIQYWLKAGQKSQQQSANVEAISHLNQGLTILRTLEESPERDQLELALQTTIGPVLMASRGWSAPEVGTSIERARQLISRTGSIADQFFVMWGLWGWRLIRADLDICQQIAHDIMHLVETSPEGQVLLSEAYWVVGCTAYYKGEFPAALKLLGQGLSLVDSELERVYSLRTGQLCGVLCATHMALAEWHLGLPSTALQRAEDAVRRAKSLGHPFTYAMSVFFCRQIRQCCGLLDQVAVDIEEEYRVCHENGFLFFEIHAVFGRGHLLLTNGKIEGARKLFEQGLEMRAATGGHLTMDVPYRNIADAFIRAGLLDDANQWLERGFHLVEKHNKRGMESEFLRLKGDLALALGDQDQAEICYQKAIEVARQQHALAWELRSATSLAQLRSQQNQKNEARQLLTSIYTTFREGFDTADLAKAKALLDELAADS